MIDNQAKRIDGMLATVSSLFPEKKLPKHFQIDWPASEQNFFLGLCALLPSPAPQSKEHNRLSKDFSISRNYETFVHNRCTIIMYGAGCFES